MDEGRKRTLGVIAAIFACRKLAALERKPSPAREMAFRNSIDLAEERARHKRFDLMYWRLGLAAHYAEDAGRDSASSHCTDCDVDLVAELPRPEPETNPTNLKHVWTGKEQDRCVALCKVFRAKGVPFKVEQNRHQHLQTVDEKYRISVPKEFFETAIRIIKRGS